MGLYGIFMLFMIGYCGLFGWVYVRFFDVIGDYGIFGNLYVIVDS